MIKREKLYNILTKELLGKYSKRIIFPETVVSIDFGTCSFNKNSHILKSGEELIQGIDELRCVKNIGIHCYCHDKEYCKIIYFNNNKPLESYSEQIKRWLPEGCCITAYNGYRLDFLVLERRFGIDLSKYILIDTMLIEKLFNYDNLRMLLCKSTDYPKIELEYSKKKRKDIQSLNSLYKNYTGVDMYESVHSPKHDSYIDARTNFDVFHEQFYKYCFTCVEEMAEMCNYLLSMTNEDNYEQFHLLSNTKYFQKIDKDKYMKENGKIIINFGTDKGKTIDEISDDKLCHMITKYNTSYGDKKHDPYIYELLYVLRLEWIKRLEKIKNNCNFNKQL